MPWLTGKPKNWLLFSGCSQWDRYASIEYIRLADEDEDIQDSGGSCCSTHTLSPLPTRSSPAIVFAKFTDLSTELEGMRVDDRGGFALDDDNIGYDGGFDLTAHLESFSTTMGR